MTIQKSLYVRAAIATSFVFALGQAMPAFAQQTQTAGGLEEIVVTARKREESLQTIPLAVTAFTSEDMARRATVDMNDIAAMTPGFNYQDYGGFGNTSPTIRGLTQIAGTANSEQNVSFFIDGVYLPRSYLTNLGIDGIDRVEVVAGPQSARYGFNAFMGAVNYISKQPTDQWHAEVEGTVGNYSRYDAKGSISGPIVPGKLDVLAGAAYSTFDGSWTNPDPDCNINFGTGTNCRSGGWSKLTFNGAVKVTPTDNLTVNFEAFHWKRNFEQGADGWFGELNANSNINNCGQYNPNVRPASLGGTGAGGQWYRLYCGQLPILNTPIDPRAYGQQLGASFMRGSVDWTITDALKVQYIYGRTAATNFANEYSDSTPACQWAFPGTCAFNMGPTGTNEAESHQVRLSFDDGGILRGELGMFYAHSRDIDATYFGLAPPLTAVPTSPLLPKASNFPALFIALVNNLVKDKIYSPFGEVNLALLDKRLRLGAEVRWTDDDKDQHGLAAGGAFVLAQNGTVVYRGSFKSWTPRFTAEYDLTKENMLYASAAKGEKSGGFNTTALAAQYQTYNPDTNWTYEVGTKNTFGNFRINADLFYVKWKDMQISAADPSNPAPIPNPVTLNLGNMTSKGVEVQGAWAPIKSLTFDASGYFGVPRYDQGTHDLNIARTPAICDNVVCAENGDISGKIAPRASKLSGTLGAEYRGDFGSMDMGYYARGEVTYQSKAYVDEDDLAWTGARAIANVTLGVTGKRYEVQLWVRNLFDKQYITSALVEAPNVNYYEALGDRRTLGITAKFRY